MAHKEEGLPDFDKVLAEAENGLKRIAPKPPLTFGFHWRNNRFAARIEPVGDDYRLRLVGDVGPLPYSAESPSLRERLLRLVQWSNGQSSCRFTVTSRRRLNLLMDSMLADPLTPTRVLSHATLALVRAAPFIELAEEMHPSAAPSHAARLFGARPA